MYQLYNLHYLFVCDWRWQREKDKLHSKIFDLEKKLDARQALELEIERMRGALHVMKHMGEDGDMELKKNMDAIVEDFKCYIGCLFIFRLHRMS